MVTVHCDACGNVDYPTDAQLKHIQFSGYGGPYCTQCGEKIEEQNILIDQPPLPDDIDEMDFTEEDNRAYREEMNLMRKFGF